MKTIVVLSGGLDSTTLLYKCIAEGKEVIAISFDYNQRHKIELEKAKETCEALNIPHYIIDITSITKFISNSALTNPDIAVPQNEYKKENMLATVVPNRNSIMANIAIGFAVNIDADEVALGVHGGDHDVYPDCRPEFITALQNLANVANYKSINIYTPYLHSSKTEIVADGLKLGVDYTKTQTCYNGTACGTCASCRERKQAFIDNGTTDPINYLE